jgi:hypothetical protein
MGVNAGKSALCSTFLESSTVRVSQFFSGSANGNREWEVHGEMGAVYQSGKNVGRKGQDVAIRYRNVREVTLYPEMKK